MVLQVTVFSQPVCLGGEITVDDITLIILERPRCNDQDIAFAYPNPLFDLALDPTHAGHSVITSDTDVIRTHHKISKSELFIGPFLG